jgi:hypothetical protein
MGPGAMRQSARHRGRPARVVWQQTRQWGANVRIVVLWQPGMGSEAMTGTWTPPPPQGPGGPSFQPPGGASPRGRPYRFTGSIDYVDVEMFPPGTST